MDRSTNPRLTTPTALAAIGVSAHSEAVWRALLLQPKATREALGKTTGLSEAQVAVALNALADAELVAAASNPAGVVALDPSLAIEARLARSERVIAEQQETLAAVRSLIPSLAGDYTRGQVIDAGPPGFLLVSGDQVNNQCRMASARYRYACSSIDQNPKADAIRRARDRDVAALARGVQVRDIFNKSALSDPGVYAEMEFIHGHGARARTLPEVPSRIIIWDRDLAVVPADPNDVLVGALFIRVQSVIDAFLFMFEHLWAEAIPVFSESEAEDAPDGRAAKILDLVVTGGTDTSIARNLGVGARTIRREVSDLKNRLGVSSRAEIAVAASRKGWL